MAGGLPWVDVAVIGLYFAAVVYLGFRHSGQRSKNEYYLANRTLSGVTAGISVAITLLSSVSLMGGVAFIYQHNLTLVMGALSLPLTLPVINRIILPFYHRLPITTGYEYLERRFDASVRTAASGLFILLRLSYLAVVIYAPAVALAVVTGWPIERSILLMGAVSVTLASLGGMKGVIWAEVLKFFALAVSMCAMLGVLAFGIAGGPAAAWEAARAGGRLRAFDFSFDPAVTFSFWWIFLGTYFQNLSTFGADQIAVQRYLTSRSLEESRKAYRFHVWTSIPINLFYSLIGIGIYAYYAQRPSALGPLGSADYILPYFAVHELPAGVAGLAIATIFALSLTTHSSGLHAINTAVMNDFYERFARKARPEGASLRTARLGSLFWGIVTTGLALYVPRLGIIMVASRKVNQFFGGVLLGLFLLGMLSRRAGGRAALGGAVAGMSAVAATAALTPASFLLYAPLGCTITIAAGLLLGRIFAPADPDVIRGFHLDRASDAIGRAGGGVNA
jgi:SSS family transporter